MHKYTTQASTLHINKPPLRNKQQAANTDKKHIHQIKQVMQDLPYQQQKHKHTK